MKATLAADRGVSAQWCLCAPDALLWREWAGDAVVFNRQSGSTHKLDVLSAQALRLISPVPTSETMLIAAIAAFLELSCDGELVEMVRDLLSRLAELGLVERVA